jgi:hypothetical protein
MFEKMPGASSPHQNKEKKFISIYIYKEFSMHSPTPS